MPNIRSQSIGINGIELVASDGRSITLTTADILAHFQSERGGKPARITATIAWVKLQIENALGPEQVPQSLIDFDFDDVAGLKHLGVSS
jgi:hypothetical protein